MLYYKGPPRRKPDEAKAAAELRTFAALITQLSPEAFQAYRHCFKPTHNMS